MPELKGDLQFPNPVNFVGVFMSSESGAYSASGRLFDPVMASRVEGATVTCSSEDDLRGMQGFEGKIEDGKMELLLANGVTITASTSAGNAPLNGNLIWERA